MKLESSCSRVRSLPLIATQIATDDQHRDLRDDQSAEEGEQRVVPTPAVGAARAERSRGGVPGGGGVTAAAHRPAGGPGTGSSGRYRGSPACGPV